MKNLLLLIFIPAVFYPQQSFCQKTSSEIQTILIKETASRHPVTLKHKPTSLQICNLEAGREYAFWLSSSEPESCGPLMEASFTKVKGNGNTRTLDFTAKERCVTISVGSDCSAETQGHLSVKCRGCPGKSIVEKMMAGISTSPNSNATFLIEDIFIGGGCFDVAFASAQGQPGQIGTFSSGTSSISIEDGIILSSGNIANAHGPNNVSSASTGYGSAGNDPDLAALGGNNDLFDAAKIEFFFTPTVSQISFQYVFASEEYCEYVGSQFNDVFGFFISGPGITGPFTNNAANIAVIPGDGSYVGINTVNHINNTAYYRDNMPAWMNTNCNFGPGIAETETQFDGFTTVLTAVANVIPCQTYKIKLVIADRGDATFDSAVFLKANSFNAGSTAAVSPDLLGVGLSGTQPYEGCGDVLLTFERVGSDLSEPFPITFTVSPASTATPGQDYAPFPTTIVIPAGQSTATLLIDIFGDFIIEGIETIILELQNPCSCISSTVEIQITEPPPLEVTIPDIYACDGQETTIFPTVTGGVPGYTYQWSNGNTNPGLVIQPSGLEFYFLQVTDACGQVANAGFTVYATAPSATLSGTDAICQGNFNASLDIEFTGFGPFDITYSIDGFFYTINGIYANPFQLPVNLPGTYQLVSVSSFGCPGQVSGTGSVTIEEVLVEVNPVNVSCYGMNDGAVDLNVSGGTGPYTFNWQGAPNVEDPDGLSPGAYNVTVTDAQGCIATASASVSQPPELSTGIGNVQHIDCTNPGNGGISATASGGTGAFSFLWNNGATTASIDSLEAGTYSLTVTDESGCTVMVSATVNDQIDYPTANASVSGILDCENETLTISGAGSSTGGPFSYSWSTTDGNIVTGTGQLDPTVDEPGLYQLIVTNTSNHCADTALVSVAEDVEAPTAEAGEGGMLTCSVETMTLDGSASSAGSGFSYNWTTADGNIVSGSGSLNPEIDAPGDYVLQVTDTQNGCADLDTVSITQDVAGPEIAIVAPGTVNCYTPEITLDAGASSIGPEFVYNWSTADGNILSGTDSLSISVDAQGTYELLITNTVNGCQSVQSVSVAENFAVPVADAGSPVELDCETSSANLDGSGSSAGSLFSYEWTSSGGNVISGGQTLQPVVDQAGLYTLTVINTESGCSAQATVAVSENSNSPQVQAAVNGILTCEVTELVIDASGSAEGPNFQIAWSSAEGHDIQDANSLNPIVSAPGSYTMTITDLSNSCISSLSIVVGQDIIAPLADAGQGFTLTCNEPEYTLDGGNSDTGDPYTLQWSSPDAPVPGDGSSPFMTVSEAGTYVLTIVNTQNGCSSSDTAIVTADQEHPLADAGPDGLLNCAVPSLTLQGGASSIGADFDFEWNTLAGNFLPDPSTLTPVSDQAGLYELVITNIINGCVSRDTVEITADFDQPTAEAGPNRTLNCFNNNFLTLDGSGSSQGPVYSYQWNSTTGNITSGAGSLTPGVDAPGDYQLIVTNLENFCRDTAFVTVFQDIEPPVVVIAQPDIITCQTPEVTLNGAGSSAGVQFAHTWISQGNFTITDPNTLTPTVSNPGVYTLEVANLQNGCVSTAEITVSQDPNIPEADAGPPATLTCAVATVELQGSSSVQGNGIVYSWTTSGGSILSGAGSPNPVVNGSGVYTLTVHNTDNGCTDTDAVEIAIDTIAPIANAGPSNTLTCTQTTLTLDGTASSAGSQYTYAWSSPQGLPIGNAGTATPTISAGGIYELMVTNIANSCIATSQVAIATDTLHPVVSIAPPGIITCADPSLTLSATATGNHPLEYSWSAGGGQIIEGDGTLNPEVNAPGLYTLSVVNTGNGCFSQVSAAVAIDTIAPVAEAGPAAELTCADMSLQLDGSGSSTAGVSYLWTTPNGHITSGATTLQPSVDESGVYFLTVTDLQNGCTAVDEVEIGLNAEAPLAAITPPATLTCVVHSVILQGFNANPSGIPLEYTWTDAQGNVLGFDNPDFIEVTQPGVYYLNLLNPENGCADSEQALVVQDIEQPTAEAGEPGVLTCVEKQIHLNAGGSSSGSDYQYLWSSQNGHIVSGAGTATPLVDAEGLYRLLVTNTRNGCTDEDEVQVLEIVPQDAEVAVTQPACHGDPGQIEITNVGGGFEPYLYSIDGGASFSDGAFFFDLDPGIYEVIVQDVNGCEYEEAAVIETPVQVDIFLEPRVLLRLGDSYLIDPQVSIPESEISRIVWTPSDELSCDDCLRPLATPQRTTTYGVLVENKNGCFASALIQLVVDRRPAIYVPNAFSPYNNDGINDRFMVFARSDAVAKVNSLLVFNRWGETIYEVYNFPPNDPQYGWDGRHRGQLMNPAVFAYWTEVELIDGTTVLLKGDVTLMK
jgi:hypothetical protein